MAQHVYSILILDDEDGIRESLSDYFADHDWDVISASSGEDALHLLESNTPDGALVDIRLPGMDGNTFIRKICRKIPRIAVIIITGSPAYSVPEDISVLECVYPGVFCKPLTDIPKLEKTLRDFIQTGDAL